MLNNTEMYPKPHGSGNGGGGNVIIINQGNGSVPLDLNVNSITSNTADINKLHAHSANIDDANIVYLMSGEGIITKLSGQEINYEEGKISKLQADEITTNKLSVNDLATIKDLITETIQSNTITTDYLTVNKSAHFFELIIDKIRSVQGTQINTAANCVLDYVEPRDTNENVVSFDSNNIHHYRCYWRKMDDNGRMTENQWLPNDQALCQTFNIETGTTQNASNKYYWRLVDKTNLSVGENAYVNFNMNAVLTYPINDYVVEIENFSFFTTDSTSDNYNQYWSTFEIVPQIPNTYNSTTHEWTVTSTTYGLQLRPKSGNEYIALSGGEFSFYTINPCKLNIGFYYDDGTFEFFPADVYKTNYSVQTTNPAAIEAIVITSQTIETWEPCNWIDLSNITKDTGSDAPSIDDNVAQLGYRYGSGATDQEKQRASAIIIAAYATPDSGLKPPSYAQYKNITDFNLSTHRHTYFDAVGAKFYGNFYIGSSDDTSQYTPVDELDAELYKIVPSHDIITKDINNDISPSTLTVTFIVPNSATTSNVVPSGCQFNYRLDNGSIGTIQAGQAVSISLATLSSKILMQLMKSGNIVDQIEKTVVEIDVASGDAGLNGAFSEWAYKNAASRPNGPTNGLPISSLDNGWGTTATTPNFGNGEYTWCTTRSNYYTMTNGVQTLHYGNWCTAYRITGDNGLPGEDGSFTEFIYTRNNTGIAPSAPPSSGTYPRDWPNDGTTDHQTVEGVTWYDNPQGVEETMMYEYVSSREYDGQTRQWSSYSEPAIWSKWGERGQDGDGLRYIYYLSDNYVVTPNLMVYAFTSTPSLDNPYIVTKRTGEIVKWRNSVSDAWYVKGEAGYLPPSEIQNATTYRLRTDWTEEPSGVSESMPVEWTSMQKYDGQSSTWGEFTSPTIWANYGGQGPQGPEGPTGPAGPTGPTGPATIEYALVDCDSNATVKMDLDNSNNITQQLDMSLKFKLMKYEGDNSDFVTADDIGDLNVYCRMSKSASSTPNYRYYKMTKSDNTTGPLEFTYTFPSTNAEQITSKDEDLIAANTNIIVALIDSTTASIADGSATLLATTNIPVTLQPKATLQIVQGQNASIRTLVTGQSGLEQQYSTMSQTMSGIQSDVVAIQSDYVNQSQLSQTADEIMSTVSSKVSNTKPNLIALSTFDNVDMTFGSNQDFDTTDADYSYWYATKSGDNGLTNFSNFMSNGTLKYMGSNTLNMTSYNFPNVSSGSPNGEIDYKISNTLISMDTTSQEYCFSIYVKKQAENSQNSVLLKVGGLASGSTITNYTNKDDREDEPSVTTTGAQMHTGSTLYQEFHLTDTLWHRLFITFKPGVTTTSPVVSMRIYRYSGDAATMSNTYAISMPKCEKGAEPSIWTPSSQSDAVLTSQIRQTAESISLTVTASATDDMNDNLRATGVDIEDGKITLNATNTIINGNLNIYNSNEGLTIYDNDGTPRATMQNSSVGTSSTFDFTTINSRSISGRFVVSNNSFDVTSEKISIGELKNGADIDVSLFLYLSSNGSDNYPSTVNGTIRLYRDGNSSAAYTNSVTWTRRATSSGYEYNMSTFSIASIVGGIYTASIQWTTSTPNYVAGSNGWIVTNFNFRQIVDSITFIGNDGFVRGSDEANYTFISDNETVFEKVDTSGNLDYLDGLRLDENGLQRLINYDSNKVRGSRETWVEASSYKKAVTLSQISQFYHTTVYYGSSSEANVYKYVLSNNSSMVIINDLYDGNTSISDNLYVDINEIAGYVGQEIHIINLRSNGNVFLYHDNNNTGAQIGVLPTSGNVEGRQLLAFKGHYIGNVVGAHILNNKTFYMIVE